MKEVLKHVPVEPFAEPIVRNINGFKFKVQTPVVISCRETIITLNTIYLTSVTHNGYNVGWFEWSNVSFFSSPEPKARR